jgi:hypothetical protein
MARYTVKDARKCFEHFRSELKLVPMKWERIGDRNVAHIGGVGLDCNATYGGCQIVMHMNEGGGQRTFGSRLSPASFCEAVSFALETLRWRDDKAYRKMVREAAAARRTPRQKPILGRSRRSR